MPAGPARPSPRITGPAARPRTRRCQTKAPVGGSCAERADPVERVYEARAGQKIRVRVHVASLARRLLAYSKTLPVTITATVISGGHTAPTARTITLRADALAGQLVCRPAAPARALRAVRAAGGPLLKFSRRWVETLA